MKKWKQIAFIFMLALSLTTFTACGKNNKTDADTQDKVNNEATDNNGVGDDVDNVGDGVTGDKADNDTEAGDNLENAKENAEEAVDNTGDAMKDTGEAIKDGLTGDDDAARTDGTDGTATTGDAETNR